MADHAAAILAGGYSRRMGRNKSFVLLKNKPLISYVASIAMRVVDRVVVVIRKEYDETQYVKVLPRNVSVLKDSLPGQTPLIGIATAMKFLQSGYCAVLPCDAPFVKPRVLEELFVQAKGHDAAIPRWLDGSIEPLQAVYKIDSALSAAEEALKRKELKNEAMIKRLQDVRYVNIDKLRPLDEEMLSFFNVNTQEDLDKANRVLGST